MGMSILTMGQRFEPLRKRRKRLEMRTWYRIWKVNKVAAERKNDTKFIIHGQKEIVLGFDSFPWLNLPIEACTVLFSENACMILLT